jgi:hypothetical protein
MHINSIFAAFTFIVIVAIILLTPDITTAILIVSLLANFLIIYTKCGEVTVDLFAGGGQGALAAKASKEPPAASATPTPAADTPPGAPGGQDAQSAAETDWQNPNMYGKKYEMYHAYNDSFNTCYDEPKPVVTAACDSGANADIALAFINQRRARDKKCYDGISLKDANYYGYHYSTELKEAEEKRWWGNAEV